MHVAFSQSYFHTEPPDWVKQAAVEREVHRNKASELQRVERCSIMEAEQRVGYVCESSLCSILLGAGLGSRSFPNYLGMLNFIVLGGVIAALNSGHRPEPMDRYDGFALFTEPYELFKQSLPARAGECPLDPQLVAALLRLFAVRCGGGHYEEDSVSGLFASFASSAQLYCTNSFMSEWNSLTKSYVSSSVADLAGMPDPMKESAQKIVEAIPLVLNDLTHRQTPTAHSV